MDESHCSSSCHWSFVFLIAGFQQRRTRIRRSLTHRLRSTHNVQAPGMDLGYAAEAFPGIQQAIDNGNLTLAQEQVRVAVSCLEAVAQFLAGDLLYGTGGKSL